MSFHFDGLELGAGTRHAHAVARFESRQQAAIDHHPVVGFQPFRTAYPVLEDRGFDLLADATCGDVSQLVELAVVNYVRGLGVALFLPDIGQQVFDLHALSGNLCRCTGYQGIIAAVKVAAAARAQS